MNVQKLRALMIRHINMYHRIEIQEGDCWWRNYDDQTTGEQIQQASDLEIEQLGIQIHQISVDGGCKTAMSIVLGMMLEIYSDRDFTKTDIVVLMNVLSSTSEWAT